MSRAVITGIGCVGPHGVGREALASALEEGSSLGKPERIGTLRGRSLEIAVARVAPFERDRFIPSRKRRRMGEVSQIWVTCCLLAREDAGLAQEPGSDPRIPPERRGTYVGTGFGCIDITWNYLVGLYRDGPGMANPYLFSESVANAPAGHSAIELDTRGPTITFTCGDASTASALQFAARGIRSGRVEMAYCGGVEMLSQPLLRVLASLGSMDFAGEGGVCFLLESLPRARARGARIYAEVVGSGAASDPVASPTEWSRDPEPVRAALAGAAALAECEIRKVFLHACRSPRAEEAERLAVNATLPGVETAQTSSIFGTLAAAGGFNLAAAALEASRPDYRGSAVMVNASSWGGGVYCLALRGAP